MAFHTLLLMAGAVNAMADNVVSIEGYDILPGQEKTLSVVMKNTDQVSFIQFDLVLPEGLVPDGEEWYAADAVRLNGLALHMTEYTYKPNHFQVLILSSSAKPIAGDEGAIIALNVKAADNFDTKGKVQIVNIKGATAVAGSRDVLTVGETGLRTGEFGNKQVQPLVQLDAETIQAITQDNVNIYALVDLKNETTLASVTAKIEKLNEDINSQKLTRTDALKELQNHIEYLEKKEGDVNLDGMFDIDDANYSFTEYMDGNDGFDFNGDGDFDIDDANALFSKYMDN